MMANSPENQQLVSPSDACRFVSQALAAAPSYGEAEWSLVHQKVEKLGRELYKMLPQAPSEEEKIALLQAGHDALYLLSGNVTYSAEQRYLSLALPHLREWLLRHASDPVADGRPLLLAFLRLSLDLLYSSRFLSAAADPLFADRLTDYTARTLDALRSGVAHPSPQLQSLFEQEQSLFEETEV